MIAVQNHAMNDGNHTVHQSPLKNRAAACLRTRRPNTFIASVMDSPINPTLSVVLAI